MKTALEVLKECREQLVSRPFTMNASLVNLKNMIEEDINVTLIQGIKKCPSIDTWIVRLPLKGFYLTTITDVRTLLRFITEIVEKPVGFEIDGVVTYIEAYNEIGIRFKEIV